MINFSYPKASYLKYRKEINKSIDNVINSGTYIKGENVSKFEKNFSKYIGTKYSIGVGNATDSIYLSLRALDVGLGDEVITVSHTATGTVAAIANTGASPVFVDIEENYYTINADEIEKNINKNTKAIIVVHIYGQACDMDAIIFISKKYGIPIIEDCAQATGAEYKGEKVGSIGEIGCFSFFPTKNLSCFGDGGLATTNDKRLFERIRSLGQYGWDNKRDAVSIGINSRLDELQAAVLNVKLKYIDQDNQERIKIANLYNSFIINPQINLPAKSKNNLHVYHLYVIRLDKGRDKLTKLLKRNGIHTGIHYPLPVHRQKVYKIFIKNSSNLKNTESIIKKIVSIPMYQGLKEKEINKTVELLNNLELA